MKTHKNYTAEDLRKAFYHKQRYKTVFMFLQEQVTKKTLMKRQGTARTYDNAMIEQYEAWLINRRLKQNSIRCYLRTLNTLLYKAAEEGLLNNRNLFSHVHLSYVKTTKRAISEKELKLIANIRLPENSSIALPPKDQPMPEGGMGKGTTKYYRPLFPSNSRQSISVSHHLEGGRYRIPTIPTYANQHKPCIEEVRKDGWIENATHHLCSSPHLGKRSQRYEHSYLHHK